MVPMFTSAAIMPRLVAPFNLEGEPNTRTKDLPKSGSVTASVVGEATAATSQTLTDTKATLTLQKAVVLFRPTLESLRFAQAGKPERLQRLAGQACAKKFDQDACALFGGFSQSVDMGVSATVDGVEQAAYLIRTGDIPSDRVAAVLSYKQSRQVGADIRNSSGSIYGNPNFSPERLMDGAQPVPGYKGKVFGIEWYETGNTTTSGGNHVGGVIAPDLAIAALYPEGEEPGFETEIATQTEFAASIVNIKTLMWYQLGEYVDAAGVQVVSDT
jgi:hypothetical protein